MPIEIDDHRDADYTVFANWNMDRWRVIVSRTDSVWLSMQDGSDFAKLMRDACATIMRDSETGYVSTRKPSAVISDRYDIHDVRNGNVVSTALVDRRTGRVWVWRSGKGGRTRFVEEEISPEPDR
jgi:hypothetical protein